jgi:hypothetical protein
VSRHRGGATRRRGDQVEAFPASPSEIGRTLREAREQRGLDLLSVHDRLGRPITQLEALETGDLDALPDQAAALSTLRRYAAFLTLDGDALALQLMEAWSATPARPRRPARELAPVTGVVTTVTSEPDHLRAFTQTGQVPMVGGAGTSAAGGSGAYGYGVTTGPPTGTLTVIAREEINETKRATARARRRRRAPVTLKLVTWLVAVLALTAVAGVVIQRQRPQWLVQAHLLRITQPDGQPLAAAPATTTVPTTHQVTHHATAPVTAGPTDNTTQATYFVNAQQFTLGIATSAPCWVQVTTPASITPLLEGTQSSGTIQSFKADKSITLQVGSSAVVIGIYINGKSVFFTTPKSTPFTYTFTSQP